jgi:hypothetical protein
MAILPISNSQAARIKVWNTLPGQQISFAVKIKHNSNNGFAFKIMH